MRTRIRVSPISCYIAMGDAGPAFGFNANNPYGMGAVAPGPPGSMGQLLGAAGGLLMGGGYAMPGDGPSGGFSTGSGPVDMGGMFTGTNTVPGVNLSTSTARSHTNALVAFTSYFGSWKGGWEKGIRKGSIFFPTKSIRPVLDGGMVVEAGGEVKAHVTSSMGQRIVPASIQIINWLLEESARVARDRYNGVPGDTADSYERREWAFVDRDETGKDGMIIPSPNIPYADRFVKLFGNMPLMEVNRGPGYEDNPIGDYDPWEQYPRSTKRSRVDDVPHLIATPGCDGYVAETYNIWGSPQRGDKLSLRLRYFDSRKSGIWENPYGAFMTPDGRRGGHGRTVDTGFLQLWPCVYSQYGDDERMDKWGSHRPPHKSTPPGQAPDFSDLDWEHTGLGPNPNTAYQEGMDFFIGTVKETPEAYDIVGNPTPLRDHAAYTNLPRVSIIFGV